MREALVYIKGVPAARLVEHAPSGTVGAYELAYMPEYLQRLDASPVSLLMPLRREPYRADVLFPYFESLLPEGAHAHTLCRALHLDPADRFGLLLALAGHDAIGNATVKELPV